MTCAFAQAEDYLAYVAVHRPTITTVNFSYCI